MKLCPVSGSPQWHLVGCSVQASEAFQETKPSGKLIDPTRSRDALLAPVCPAVSRARLALPPSNVLLGVHSQLGPVEGHPDARAVQVASEREGHGDDLPGPAGILRQALQRGREDQELYLGADHAHQRRAGPDAPEPLRCGAAGCPSLPLQRWSTSLCLEDFSLFSGVFQNATGGKRCWFLSISILLPTHPCYLGCFKCGWILLKLPAPAHCPRGHSISSCDLRTHKACSAPVPPLSVSWDCSFPVLSRSSLTFSSSGSVFLFPSWVVGSPRTQVRLHLS